MVRGEYLLQGGSKDLIGAVRIKEFFLAKEHEHVEGLTRN
jgi:hypothetical protein